MLRRTPVVLRRPAAAAYSPATARLRCAAVLAVAVLRVAEVAVGVLPAGAAPWHVCPGHLCTSTDEVSTGAGSAVLSREKGSVRTEDALMFQQQDEIIRTSYRTAKAAQKMHDINRYNHNSGSIGNHSTVLAAQFAADERTLPGNGGGRLVRKQRWMVAHLPEHHASHIFATVSRDALPEQIESADQLHRTSHFDAPQL